LFSYPQKPNLANKNFNALLCFFLPTFLEASPSQAFPSALRDESVLATQRDFKLESSLLVIRVRGALQLCLRLGRSGGRGSTNTSAPDVDDVVEGERIRIHRSGYTHHESAGDAAKEKNEGRRVKGMRIERGWRFSFCVVSAAGGTRKRS
jgi:hypothetical protein